MAHPSLYPLAVMNRHVNRDRRCSYVVALRKPAASPDELRALSSYLSTLGVACCDVIVLDASPRDVFEENRRVLRWVARHVAVRTPFDVVRTAIDYASCDKVIVAGEDVRYTQPELDGVCTLLETHEVVEPQDYLDPLPWWGGIEAGRMLLHRGIEPYPDHGATFGFRRNTLRGLRGMDTVASADHVRRLAAQGAEVFSAHELFVRREPPQLGEWIEQRPRLADDDFEMPVKSAIFFAILPILVLVGAFGGVRMAASFAAMIAFGALCLAMHGRAGAAAFFPLRTAFYAPLWVFERAISVYWALLRKVRSAGAEPPGMPAADRSRKEKVASGE